MMAGTVVFFLGIRFVLSKLLLNVFLAVLTTLYGIVWDEPQALKASAVVSGESVSLFNQLRK
jgi:hypothetical protein